MIRVAAKQRKKFYLRENGCPAWIRTMTKSSKDSCATITPPDNTASKVACGMARIKIKSAVSDGLRWPWNGHSPAAPESLAMPPDKSGDEPQQHHKQHHHQGNETVPRDALFVTQRAQT